MSYQEKDIAFECGQHWVLKLKMGYEVYRTGVTHSTRCAIIGWPGDLGLGKAVDEVLRRESLRGFHIIALNEKTQRSVQCTDTPLSHAEACVMLSKFTPHPNIRRFLREV